MPDRHRHDEFLWALIFSLIVNLLIVFAIVLPPWRRAPARFPTVVVSIVATKTAPRSASSGKEDRAAAGAKSSRIIKMSAPALSSWSQNANDEPIVLPVERVNEISTLATVATETGRADTALPLSAAAGTAATLLKEKAEGPTISGDKNAGDHYTAPERLTGVEPWYPQQARRHGWEGKGLMTLLINAEGRVERVDLAESSGYDLLDRSAREAIASWRFKPARRNGLAVAETVQLPFIFRLNSSSGLAQNSTRNQRDPSSPTTQAENRR